MRMITLALASLFIAQVAVAQPRAVRRNPGPPPTTPAAPPPGKTIAPLPPDKAAGRAREVNKATLCRNKQQIVAQEQSRLDEARAGQAGVDAEIADLERRLQYLRQRKGDLAREVSQRQTTVSTLQADYKKDCERDETCDQYEALVTQLEQQSKPMEMELDDITREITTTQATIADLRRRIEPLAREYTEKRCNSLVAGETTQETIDRCSAIFSDWNRAQAQVNSLNGRLAQLRQRQGMLASNLEATQRRAQDYDTYLRQRCQTSTRIGSSDRYQRVRERANQAGSELDKLINELGTLRGMRLQ